MSGSTPDTLNQADALLAPIVVTPAMRLAAERYVARHCTGADDQRHLTEALGLGPAPEKRKLDSAERRAVPDGFRRAKSQGRTG